MRHSPLFLLVKVTLDEPDFVPPPRPHGQWNPIAPSPYRRWAPDPERAEALRIVKAGGFGSVGRAGWQASAAEAALPGVTAMARIERQHAADVEAARRQHAADLQHRRLMASPPITRPTRVHFAKGCVSVMVPIGTVAVTDGEWSTLVAYDGDERPLAAWRVKQDGPTAWAVLIDPSEAARSWTAAPTRRPGRLSAVDRAFGRAADE